MQVENAAVNKKIVLKILSWLLLALLIIFTFFPFVWVLFSSMKVESNIFNIPPTIIPKNPGQIIINYSKLFTAEPVGFARILINSFMVAIGVAVGSIFVGALAGFAFAKYEFKFKRILFYTVIATMMIPFQVLVIPLYREILVLNWGDTLLALVIPFFGRAYTVFLLRQFMVRIPSELMDAARLDGCSEFKIFTMVAVPLAKAGIVIAAIFNFIFSWSQFLWPLVVTSSPRNYVISIFLGNLITARTKHFGMLFAGTTLSFLVVAVLFFILQKSFFKTFEISFDK